MKKVILAAMCIALASCGTKEEASFANFSGKIENLSPTDSVLTLKTGSAKKDIALKKDGTFNDTLHVEKAGYYTLSLNGRNVGFTFLRNGFDLKLTADKTNFLESSAYSGKGSNSINFLLSQYKIGRSFGDPRAIFALDKETFTKKLSAMKYSFDSLKKAYKDIDTMLIRRNDKQNHEFFTMLERSYNQQHAIAKQQAEIQQKLGRGKPSPKFNNYLNYKGGKSSLDSFKGKYVYIDVWATWCNPCLAEIPALKSLEKKYHSKNIQFVSISIDDESTAGSWDKALAKWKKMVKDKNLTGAQLYAGKDIQFMKDYMVTGIPRFILIDPKGNIVESNAPRPSDPRLENLFKKMGL